MGLLKGKLTSAPVLSFPDFACPFFIYADACDEGLAAALMQRDQHCRDVAVACASQETLGVQYVGVDFVSSLHVPPVVMLTSWYLLIIFQSGLISERSYSTERSYSSSGGKQTVE